MSHGEANIQQAPGEIIQQSTLKALGMIAFLLVMLVGGLVLATAWWLDIGVPLPAGVVHINLAGGMVGVVAAAIAAVLTPLVTLMLFVGEKLIIARDRLQIVHKLGGDKVVVQFPYANIAKIFCGDDEGVKFIGILLQNPADPDTFATGWNFATTDASDGWHYKIPDTYQRSLTEIHELILKQLRARENA